MNDHTALFQLGMDLAPGSSTAQEEVRINGHAPLTEAERRDYFIERDGRTFAGTHLIIDLHEARRLDDIDHVRATLVECVRNAGATLLHIHLHHFTPNGGISGVAVLAESHISIHTWPERDYAALDVFMCGAARPEATIPVLRKAFGPCDVNVSTLYRGEGL